MSIWQSLRDLALEVIADLDAIGERIGEAFGEHVMPPVQDAAGWLDAALEGTSEKLTDGVRSQVALADSRYQQFMIERVDPLFGRTRTAQLAEMGSLEVSPHEVSLNRRIALTAGLFLALVVGNALFPASLVVTVPISFALVLPVYKMAERSVRQHKRVTYHLVSAINVTAVWLGGYYVPAVGAMIFFYLGEKLLMITEDRSHKGLISVFSKQPRMAWVLRDDIEQEVPFETVTRGDIVVIDAGGFIPVDGTVIQGVASIDQHALTGEAQPAEKGPGDGVYASTVVLAGKIFVQVDKAGSETVAAKIGEILNRTASYQLALQSRGNKIAHDAALPTLALTAAALPLGGERALAMLNSAFGVSVRISAPITMLNLFNIASANAVLMKDGRSLELLAEVDTVLFDKTGTLTMSQPNVAAVYPAGRFTERDVLMFAAAAEHRQTHPIALAILAEASAKGIAVPNIDSARYDVGYGIKVVVDGQTVQVGSDRYMTMEGIEAPAEIVALRSESQAKGNSMVLVAVEGVLAGAIELQPTIRPEVDAVIGALRKRGLKLFIISGDQEAPTKRLAEKLGMDRYFANVLPEGKAGLVEQLQREGHGVCFVGDGINDGIALKKANVSVSLRGATTVATDSAQVVLMQESLEKLPLLFDLADDMDRCLRWGYTAGMVPGVINVAGVFFFGTGYLFALALNLASMAAAMGVALYPVYKRQTQKTAATEKPGPAGPSSPRVEQDAAATHRLLPALASP